MTMLSANFDDSEFSCHCCGQVVVGPSLVEALQLLRNNVGVPIKILSGYRCYENNRRCGGTKDSQHLQGLAADIVIQGYSVREMYQAALGIPAFNDGGIGIYCSEGFIHVDSRGYTARWARVNRGEPYTSIQVGLQHCR